MITNRIQPLNKAEKSTGDCVLYVMSRDQRVEDNYALLAAAESAETLNLPLVVCFIIYPTVKNRINNQFEWMVEGLQEVEKNLHKLNIPFLVFTSRFSTGINSVIKKFQPASVYFDFSPLVGPLSQKRQFAENSNIPCYVVDTHNIVPVWQASAKEEFSARTIRPKINSKLNQYLIEPQSLSKRKITPFTNKFLNQKIDWSSILQKVESQKLNNYKPNLISGSANATETLKSFLKTHLINYAEKKNDPTLNVLSNLSPYLHFGQISSLRVALEVEKYVKEILLDSKLSNADKERLKKSKESFLEELIVRKELAENYCFYNKNYNNINGAKEWARHTLQEHAKDKREFLYSYKELELAETHDDAWNAAQKELTSTGKIHGYLRMYWAKKLLEWTQSPEQAIEFAIQLNDKFSLDGYDPNGYAGIMWSICGIHDKPWFERNIFGKIRYMNYNGLKRKFKIEEYIKKNS